MIVELWMATAAANGIIAVIYGAISVTMIREAILGRQWWQNPLLTATVAIFVTCTIGHGMHMAHAVLDTWGASDHAAVIGHATRATFVDERLLIWDSVTAFVAVWYWGLRTALRSCSMGQPSARIWSSANRRPPRSTTMWSKDWRRRSLPWTWGAGRKAGRPLWRL